jgi:hypothetical protein
MNEENVILTILTLLMLLTIFFMINHFVQTKKHYYMSYDGVFKLVYIHQTDESKTSLNTKARLNVNENLYLDIEYFVGFVHIYIWKRENGEWKKVETIDEDIWNSANGLFKIKGPWKTEIIEYLKNEYENKSKDIVEYDLTS